MKARILMLALVALSFQAVAQHYNHYVVDKDATPREHQIDVTHMTLTVDFVPKEGKVNGKVIHQFVPMRKRVDSIFWDAPDIDIKSARLIQGKSSQEVRFTTSATGVTTFFSDGLVWDKAYAVEFEYTAHPKKGIYFIGWNSPEITDPRNQTRQQIWTQGQGIDNRHWIPMYDNMNDKFITETIVTFDDEFKVLSNGDKLAERKNKNGTKTWHYKMRHQHAGYLLMLAIDRFAVKETKTKNGTPVQFWYYPEHAEKLEPSSRYTEKIIEFLEEETGYPYPWGAYSQVMVQDFMYGAMENTSATIFGDFFNVDSTAYNDRNYVSVNAHELTHQWFGDLITARSSRGTWLQESFATYYAKLFMGHLLGDDAYRMNQRGEAKSALNASKNDNNPVAHTKAGSARVYPKGSHVLHMLRYVIGDEEYKRVIKHYLHEHAFGNVLTEDLEMAVQDVLGMQLDWFFDQWIRRGGEPHYKVTEHRYTNGLALQVDQIQEQTMTIHLFKMPINCGVYFTDGTSIEKQVWVEYATEVIKFDHADDKQVAYVLFDINSEILKDVTFEKGKEELLNQLAGAKHMIDRYDALTALSSVAIDDKREALQEAFKKESFHAMQAEIVQQLLDDDKSEEWLKENLKGADVRVRRVVLNKCDNVVDYKEVFVESLDDESYINQEKAFTCLCEQVPSERPTYLTKMDGRYGMAHSLRVAYLVEQIKYINSLGMDDGARQDRDNKLNELVNYTSNLYEFRTRINAMNALKVNSWINDVAFAHMLDASLNNNRRLAGPAQQHLRYYLQVDAYKQRIQKAFEGMELSDKDKKQLKNLGLVN